MSDMFEKVAQMASQSQKWKRVDKHAMQRGNQTICKKFLDGCTLYVLYEGETEIGHFEDKEEGFALADARIRQTISRRALKEGKE